MVMMSTKNGDAVSNNVLDGDVKRLIKIVGFESPTLVQSLAIPKILKHDLDVIISAPTGSGKTEAVLLPLMHKITTTETRGSDYGVRLLYITPLRALNRDIYRRIEQMASHFKMSVGVWHSDTTYSIKKKVLKNPPSILITTPESFQILLTKGVMRNSFSNLHAVVIDEAQDILSSERGTELVVGLERLDWSIGRHVRRILISALINDIDSIAQYFFSKRRYDYVYVKGYKKYEIDVIVLSNVHENEEFNEDKISVFLCRNILNHSDNNQIILFTNTRTLAEELSYMLSECLGKDIALHHGSLSRELRESVEKMFKMGNLRMLIATSSLELGIDIGGVDLVIQYMSPRQALRLVQRVGRAGHKEHEISKGIIIVPPLISELVESIVISRRVVKGILESLNYHTEALDVLAHQIIGIILEKNYVELDEIWKIITKATPFNFLTKSQFELIINFLNTIGMIRCENNKCTHTKRGRIYYVTTNMIPDTTHYEVKSILDGKSIGVLDEEFVLACSEDDTVVLAGRLWKILKIDVERKEVIVSPIESTEQIILPKWVGDLIPVHKNIARETCAFIRRFCDCNDDVCIDSLMSEYSIGDNVVYFIKKNRNKFCRIYPRDDVVVVEVVRVDKENKTLIGFYTCLGTKASEAFSLILGHLIKQEIGVPIAYKSHQLGTVILVNVLLSSDVVKRIIKNLFRIIEYPDKVENIVRNEIMNNSLFKWKLVNVAKKLGVIGKNIDISNVKRVIESLLNIDVVVQETLREIYTDKIDISEVLKFVQFLKHRKLKFKIIITSKPSPFLQEITALSALRSLIKHSIIPRETMIEIVKRRILEKKIKLFCIFCYSEWEIDIKDMLNSCKSIFSCFINCPYCDSKAVTLIDSSDDVNLIKKSFEKIKKSQHSEVKFLQVEKEVLQKHRKIVDFVMSHGLAGIIALQGVGIGVETAKRIIARSSDLNSLIENIIEQEKIYLRTSKYWQ